MICTFRADLEECEHVTRHEKIMIQLVMLGTMSNYLIQLDFESALVVCERASPVQSSLVSPSLRSSSHSTSKSRFSDCPAWGCSLEKQ